MGQDCFLCKFCIPQAPIFGEFFGFQGYKRDLISWGCVSISCTYPLHSAKCYQNPSTLKSTLCFLRVIQPGVNLFQIFMSFKRRACKVLGWHSLLGQSVKHLHHEGLNPEGFTDYCIASSYKNILSRKGNTEKILNSEPLISLFMLLAQPPVGYEPSSLLPPFLLLLPPELFPST